MILTPRIYKFIFSKFHNRAFVKPVFSFVLDYLCPHRIFLFDDFRIREIGKLRDIEESTYSALIRNTEVNFLQVEEFSISTYRKFGKLKSIFYSSPAGVICRGYLPQTKCDDDSYFIQIVCNLVFHSRQEVFQLQYEVHHFQT